MLTSNLKKNHCELEFWTNFASKYAQKLKVFDKKRHLKKKNRHIAGKKIQKTFVFIPPPKKNN